ncbi:DUF222 domain-containing protein [Mycolicibacterium sp. J2]|uniref:DUF222 domain-containing protein n=1 Tax=Mycolicibacterium sp. J2 TaxID=2993511 RepID=UPI00224B59D1|nr:DUF222 domain-containing protein [Mycolicibacterium sp. J2]MCX2713446.1 DUF222 domain-containing protein [Mycolicibacterium sp. J2]
MLAKSVADREVVSAAFDAVDTAAEQLAGMDFTCFSVAELLALQSRRERQARIAASADHRILAALQNQATAREMGGKSWPDILSLRLGISQAQAKARVQDAEHLGPRHVIGGEVLEPLLPACAEALAAGVITLEHAGHIRDVLRKSERYTTATDRAEWERTLVGIAAANPPETVKDVGAEMLYLLDQDGSGPDLAAHQPGLRLGPQDADGLHRLSGHVDAEAAAYFKAIESVWAAPGINNPADTEPLANPTPNPLDPDEPPEMDAAQRQAEAAERDTRSPARRSHDAFKTMCRDILMSKRLGQHNGLPVTVVVSTTLAELEDGAGVARSSSGVKIPIPDLIRLAAHAHHYLLVFKQHTAEPLYLGRTKRLASKAQRLVAIARDRGCTRPGCFAPADRCQANHAGLDWSAGGETNADTIVLGCGPDNRLAYRSGWTTTIDPTTGRAQWHPPALLDTGQDRTNHHFHPEELLRRSDGNVGGDDP